jgi:hypothetical protein
MTCSDGPKPSGVPALIFSHLRGWSRNDPRINNSATNRSARLQPQLRARALRQSAANRLTSSQDFGPQSGKLALYEHIEPDLRHERSVPAVRRDIRAFAGERTERARPRASGTEREEVGEVEELAALETVPRHVAFEPEYLRDLHLEL